MLDPISGTERQGGRSKQWLEDLTEWSDLTHQKRYQRQKIAKLIDTLFVG